VSKERNPNDAQSSFRYLKGEGKNEPGESRNFPYPYLVSARGEKTIKKGATRKRFVARPAEA